MKEKRAIETLNMCCGSKRCPIVHLYDDGTLSTVDGEHRIEYTAEQVVKLRALLIATLPKEDVGK